MRTRMSGLWRDPAFLKLWGSDTISLFGVHATLLALPVTAIALGASAFQLGLLTVAQAAPALLLGLFVGVWVDRRRRRPLLIAANLARAAALGAIPLAAFAGRLHLAHLYLAAFLAGAAAILFVVAYQAFLPTIVPRERLVDGNSALRASEATAQFAGPSLGGLLVPLLTAPGTLAVGALASLGSALAVAAIRVAEPPPGGDGGQRLGGAIGEGVRFVLGHPILRPLLLISTGGSLCSNMIVSIAALYVTSDLGLPAWAFGAVIGTGWPGGAGRGTPGRADHAALGDRAAADRHGLRRGRGGAGGGVRERPTLAGGRAAGCLAGARRGGGGHERRRQCHADPDPAAAPAARARQRHRARLRVGGDRARRPARRGARGVARPAPDRADRGARNRFRGALPRPFAGAGAAGSAHRDRSALAGSRGISRLALMSRYEATPPASGTSVPLGAYQR